MSPRKASVFEPYGITVFCDDVRHEVGNKNTLVGVYATDLIVPELPIILPKLGFSVNIVSPEFNNPVRIDLLIFFPGDRSDTPVVSMSNTLDPAPVQPDSEDPDVPPHSKILQQLVLSPVEIKAEGLIKVRLNINSKRVKAGVLRVKKADPLKLRATLLAEALTQHRPAI